jgi:hypothetical protein
VAASNGAPHIYPMRWLFVFAMLAFAMPALAQSGGPTADQLRVQQLQHDEQQQQLHQLQTQQPPGQPPNPQIRSLQRQLDRQQLELQRLKQQQQSCPPPPGHC